MNFQYLERLEIEFLDSNVKLKKAVLSVEEDNIEKSSSYEEVVANINKSSKGLILKELLEHLYAFLQPEKRKPVIISTELIELEKQKLLEILKKYQEAIAWSIEDLKGINPSICMHKILLEDNAKTSIEHKRMLNPVIKEVFKKEVLKWLNAGFIYAISVKTLMPPTTVKGIRSFLAHASFYKRFIKDFSKISRPLCRLLEKDANFDFNESCRFSFEEIKSRLVIAPIMLTPD